MLGGGGEGGALWLSLVRSARIALCKCVRAANQLKPRKWSFRLVTRILPSDPIPGCAPTLPVLLHSLPKEAFNGLQPYLAIMTSARPVLVLMKDLLDRRT